MKRQNKLFSVLPLNYTPLKFMLDVLLWTLATPVAFWLRLESSGFAFLDTIVLYTSLGLIVKILLVLLLGLPLQSWHKAGIRDLYQIIRAVALGALLLVALQFTLRPLFELPRSIPPLEGLLAAFAMGSVRMSLRMMHEHAGIRQANGHSRHVLVIGAGDAGTMIAREMMRHPEDGMKPIGFLDDDPTKRLDRILGLPVFGPLDALPKIAQTRRVDEILIAIPSAPGKTIRRVFELARQAGITYRIVPGVYEILSGKVQISQIRNVDVDDLLRREPIELDCWGISEYIKDQIVMVTGAGGSIGSEIVRQVAPFRPRALVLVGRGENSLFELEAEVQRRWPALNYCIVVANVADTDKVHSLFHRYQPHVVFHAAAHKHVPMMELNPDEAILNNVGGTRNLVEAALSYGVQRFVNISTDKAVHPISIMGASKRVAEYVVAWGAHHAKPGQRFVSVRFGNVLGSRGSVIPVFKKQIQYGGPVTVTHEEATRFFMTIPEAAELVLEAARLGENGAIYLLDMGEPVKIVDLATDLIRLSGLEPGEDIEIKFTGLRPGEKLHEELLSYQEGTVTTKHEKIFTVLDPELSTNGRGPLLDRLFLAACARDEMQIRKVLEELIPTYHTNGVHSSA